MANNGTVSDRRIPCTALNWDNLPCQDELGHYSNPIGKPPMGGNPHSRNVGDSYITWYDSEKNCTSAYDAMLSESRRKQVGGDHYQGGTMQPFDVIDAFGLDFYEGSAVKYLLRWRKKNGVEDLEKAKHYIEILIEREKNGN